MRRQTMELWKRYQFGGVAIAIYPFFPGDVFVIVECFEFRLQVENVGLHL